MADEITDLPRTQRLWPDERVGPWRLEFQWKALGGRAEVIGLTIEPLLADHDEPVTTSLLRQLRLLEIATEERERLAEKAEAASLAETRPRPLKMRPGTERRLKKAAEVYTRTWRKGGKPVQAVAKAMNVTPAAATKLVFRARAAGFLPPASPGVPVG
jgi:hypothetical protein